MKRGRRQLAEKCIISTCDRDAVVVGKCARCYNNVRYHTAKGARHVARWVVAVRLKSGRLPHMMEE